ncbi:MAG: DUF58 domain-containing protein [Halobacterium sp.]
MTGQSRFTGGLLATLALAGAGVASGRSTLFVAAVVPLVFVLYGAVAVPRRDPDVRLTRTLSTDSPLPGDRVRVELTVENAGDTALPDVRLADGVPADLRVVEGTPDAALALPEDGTATVEYTVVADRGQFPFDPVTVRVRGASASAARTVDVQADGAGALDCRVSVADIPLRQQTTPHSGSLPTDAGGPGIEFHSTRDYQRGDPASRINWRRYAKTGELSTVNYRERRAAAVVLAVDARESCDVSAREGTPSGASLSAYAAAQAVGPLEDAGHQVGLAVFGIDDPVTGGSDPAWVPPGTGDAHHARIATVLDAAVGNHDDASGDAAPADGDASSDGVEAPRAAVDGGNWLGVDEADAAENGAGDSDGGEQTASGAERTTEGRINRFAPRVDPGTQLVVCSPALDEFPVALSRRVAADGHRVTAVCPDVTATDTTGRTLAAADRALALSDLRSVGARVVDWTPEESLASAVARATAAVGEGQR